VLIKFGQLKILNAGNLSAFPFFSKHCGAKPPVTQYIKEQSKVYRENLQRGKPKERAKTKELKNSATLQPFLV
jgi:hypothetical protein